MTKSEPAAAHQDFLSADVKIAECRRQSDQLDYFAHSYCKLYGDWQDSEARMNMMRERQPLLLIMIVMVLVFLLGLNFLLGSGNSGIGAAFIIGAAIAAYVVIDQVRREESRCDEIRRSKESFSASLFLAGVDLSIPLLEETLVRDPSGKWILGSQFGKWRMTQLNSVFYRVFGVVVPAEIIEKACSRN